jgi:hypothetical protein
MSREKWRFFRKFSENFIMDFYEKIKSHVKMKGLTIDGYFSSLFAGDKNKESFSGWKKRHIYPRADEAIILAKDMQTTVEELIDGEVGAEYIRQLVRDTGGVWEPPPRIADIVQNLALLNDRDLDIIRGAVSAAVAGSKKGTGTERPAG